MRILLMMLFVNMCCGSILRFTQRSPSLDNVQYSDTPGVSIGTNSVFNGNRVYASSFIYPTSCVSPLPPNALGRIVSIIGAVNVTASKGVGQEPFDSWVGPINTMFRTNVTGEKSIFSIDPRVTLGEANITLSFETVAMKGKLPTVTINYANCLMLFI